MVVVVEVSAFNLDIVLGSVTYIFSTRPWECIAVCVNMSGVHVSVGF